MAWVRTKREVALRKCMIEEILKWGNKLWFGNKIGKLTGSLDDSNL